MVVVLQNCNIVILNCPYYSFVTVGSFCSVSITVCKSCCVCEAVTVKRNRPVLTGTVGGRMALSMIRCSLQIRLALSVSSLDPIIIGKIGVSEELGMPKERKAWCIYSVLLRRLAYTLGSSSNTSKAPMLAPISAGDKAVAKMKGRL